MKALNDRGRLVLGRTALLSTAALALVLGGCAAKQPQTQAYTPAPRYEGSPEKQPVTATTTMPNTPTAANVVIAKNIRDACGISDNDAYFGFDSAALKASDRGPLDKLATCFTSGPMNGRTLRLVGHADPRGTPDYNMTLGQSRADGVAAYLAQKNLGGSRVTTTSRGSLDAIGTDEATWANDRRVDIVLGD